MVNRVGVDIFGDGLSHGGPDEVDHIANPTGRFGSESVAGLNRNQWPLWIGISGRFASECAAFPF